MTAKQGPCSVTKNRAKEKSDKRKNPDLRAEEVKKRKESR